MRYVDEVVCNVLPMDACHVLLGRPWQFDKKAVHDGFTNRHSFDHKGKKITMVPLSPSEVHQDQVQLKKNRDQEPKADKPETSTRNSNFFVKESQVRKSLCSQKPFLLLIYKESLLQFHLPIITAPERNYAYLNVMGEFRQHVEGEPIIFDGSLDHFAINESDVDRTIVYMEFKKELTVEKSTKNLLRRRQQGSLNVILVKKILLHAGNGLKSPA